MFQVRHCSASPKEEQADAHHQHVQVAGAATRTPLTRRPSGIHTCPLMFDLNGSLEQPDWDCRRQCEELCCRPSFVSVLTGCDGVFQEAVQRSGLLA